MNNTNTDPIQGFYRFPTIHKKSVIFTAEGDLWQVSVRGGTARRLTTHHGVESHAAVSPNGRILAFSAQYEGPTEVYTMPVSGGRPQRHTFEDGQALVVGWTPDGKIIYSTTRYATLPNTQLCTIDLESGATTLIPLAQASDGSYDASGKTLYFTRLPFQGSFTKRYKGGTVQNIWKFTSGADEAIPLTADYAGTSKTPMWWNGRLYFATDRDGTMNLWSMDENGDDLQQHTEHKGWDIHAPALHNGKIVYQLGADLYLYAIDMAETTLLDITLASDLDQTRHRWVKNPINYLSHWSLSPDGDRVVFTTRGKVFVAPVEHGRFIQLTRSSHARYRSATFSPDGKSIFALSDASGELDYYKLPADGLGTPEQLTDAGPGFRHRPQPSPDGKWFAYTDRDQQLWVVNIENRDPKLVVASDMEMIFNVSWSPDSRWLAFTQMADNTNVQIMIYSVEDGGITAVTSDRVYSYNPQWSPDGQWLYFLSDRHFNSLVPSPWGARQPDPYFDKTTKIYQIALQKETRLPFQPDDELYKEVEKKSSTDKKDCEKKEEPCAVEIEFEGLSQRLYEVPLAPGNYVGLSVNKKALFWLEKTPGQNGKYNLAALEIKNKKIEPIPLARDIKGYSLSHDGEKIAVRQNNRFYRFNATGKPPKPDDKKWVNLSGWTFDVDLQQEWRQMFIEAWRLERDYFYDPNLHGIDWQGLLDRHLPLVNRVTDRYELDHLIMQVVGEMAALHTFVHTGDARRGQDRIRLAALGATWVRDEAAGGYRIEHIYRSEPDYPERLAPLARPEVNISEGSIVQMINGVSTLSVAHPALLLRNQAGNQVRVRVKMPALSGADVADSDTSTDKIIIPISTAKETDLRYGEWEYLNRLHVDEKGNGRLGYVHLRAMSGENYTEWAEHFYAVFNREGLIIDVRHNRGGNIDSWILGKLLRRAWFYWQPRVGKPSWNMHYAFRGQMVVICNERTSSDGEVFADGFRRLGLGKLIGTRTWGGEIWLSRNNHLVDKGIATAAQTGVYDAAGDWLIEGHGVDPDIVVDNLPHATFNGSDAQLNTAIHHLLTEIEANPNPVPPPPPHPDKSFDYRLK
ncbi:MAG: protease [Chloroflexi bacterium]|nr:MAG: protease [Chloroflexota bacterium]